MGNVETIVVGLHLRWNGVWQRPNHIVSRLARRRPVIVVEEPQLGIADLDVVTHTAACTLVQPRRRHWTDVIDDRVIATVRNILGGRSPLIWLYTAQMLALADAWPDAPVVYDKMDDLTHFKDADPRIALREPQLLARAAFAFAGGRSLAASIEGRTRHTRCLPSAVDAAHFSTPAKAPADLAKLGHPRLGYVGVIDERLDLELIANVAAIRPNWTIVLVGPTAKIDPSTLPRAENIRYMGKRDYAELPSILAGCDVAIMPFAHNAATLAISPTKTLEYLAAGLPVVSTRIPDVVSDYSGLIELADGPLEFVEAVRRSIGRGRTVSSAAKARVAANSWESLVNRMIDDLVKVGLQLEATAPPIVGSHRLASLRLAPTSIGTNEGA